MGHQVESVHVVGAVGLEEETEVGELSVAILDLGVVLEDCIHLLDILTHILLPLDILDKDVDGLLPMLGELSVVRAFVGVSDIS